MNQLTLCTARFTFVWLDFRASFAVWISGTLVENRIIFHWVPSLLLNPTKCSLDQRNKSECRATTTLNLSLAILIYFHFLLFCLCFKFNLIILKWFSTQTFAIIWCLCWGCWFTHCAVGCNFTIVWSLVRQWQYHIISHEVCCIYYIFLSVGCKGSKIWTCIWSCW